MDLVLNLSPKTIRRAGTTIPAPKVTWTGGDGAMRYQAKVDGATYQLTKSGRSRDSVWHLSKLNRALTREMDFPVWEALCLNNAGATVFGHTLVTAKANAAMHLVRGAHPERSDWTHDR